MWSQQALVQHHLRPDLLLSPLEELLVDRGVGVQLGVHKGIRWP